jgi:hypothetical protein
MYTHILFYLLDKQCSTLEFANDRTFDDVSLTVFQDFSKKCSHSRTNSKFQDIPGQNFFSRISRTGGRPENITLGEKNCFTDTAVHQPQYFEKHKI